MQYQLILPVRIPVTILCFFVINALKAQDPVPAIGNWREHLPYNSAIDVTAGDGKIFCATPYSLFSVNTMDNNLERYSRVTGLSETGVSAIQFDSAGHKLIIAYSNSNIDILYRNDIFNIPDIKRDNIAGDKTIYNIYIRGGRYYLSTGLGVIVLDGGRYEVQDSWFIGTSGNQVKVNGFTSDGIFFYAATEEGLKRASMNTTNLADPNNWAIVQGNGLAPGACKNVINVQDKIIAEKNDSLFLLSGSNWGLLYTDGWPFINTNSTESKIALTERKTNGTSRVLFLGIDAVVTRIIAAVSVVSFPRKAILSNTFAWVADQYGGLSQFDASNTFVNYSPNSPQGIASGEMIVNNSTFYATAGTVNSAWNYQYNGDGLFQLKDGLWNNINRYHYSSLDSVLDLVSIAIDKRDRSAWAGSFGGGLIHIKDGLAIDIYKQGKIEPAIGDPTSYRVAGLAFDTDNNLWVSNFGSSQPLKVLTADGNWRMFAPPFTLTENAMSQLLVDDNNFKWIVSPLGNGLVVFDDHSTIDNTGDDRWKRFRSGAGNGNLPGSEVLSIAKDKNGYIWVGTDDGAAVIECPELVFSANSCDARWPVVPNGNFAGYLFKGQEVRSIAIDGANRKWMATRNGVFLVNETGEKLLYRFTEDNSPLLSSDVKKIALDGKTGEVFFATAKGICSFRSTATEGGTTNENVLVFPNPVPPQFTGTIAIRGLAENAIVKITELNGRLVYQTRALGGQATWDGKNYNGQRISSGAYLVLVARAGGKEEVATKIFFISK